MAGPDTAVAASELTIGDWTLHLGSRRLRRGNETCQLEPKDLAVLVHLAWAAPNMVSTAELLERNWPGMVVGDNALHQVIGRLRRALGDHARRPKYIETLARSGYRLLVRVASNDDGPKTARGSRPAGGAGPRIAMLLTILVFTAVAAGALRLMHAAPKSDLRPTSAGGEVVAVQTLRDLSPDQSLAWLAEGISQELERQIGSSDRYEILPGVLLQNEPALIESVSFAMSGSVVPKGNGVAVKLELVDVPHGKQLWGADFEGDSQDPYELQMQIATSIAGYFGWSVGAMRNWGPTKPEAYRPFLQYLHGGTYDDQLYWLQRALEIDPDWTAGWENLATRLQFAAGLQYDTRYLERARYAVEQAQRTDSAADTALAAIGYLDGYWKGDLRFTEALFRTHRFDGAYAGLMRDAGLYAEAERYFRYRIEQVGRYDGYTWYALAGVRASRRDIEGTFEAVRNCGRLTAPNSFNCQWPLIWALPAAGRFDEAEALIKRIANDRAKLRPDSIAYGLRTGLMYSLEANLAQATGDRLRAARAMENYMTAPFHLCGIWIYMLQFDDPRAADYLRLAAADAPFLRSQWDGIDPYIFDELRHRPEVTALRAAIGFTPEWRLELCQRASTFPADSHIACNPSDYEK